MVLEILSVTLKIFLAGIVFSLLVSVTGFLISLWKKNNGFADVLYPWHFVLFVTLAQAGSMVLGKLYGYSVVAGSCVYVLVLLWGLRLSLRILRKNKGKPEDFRYAAWRNTWVWFKTRSFFQIYFLQGVLAVIIAFPAFLSVSGAGIVFGSMFEPPLAAIALFAFGILLWVVGFLFETFGDAQLDRFIKNPENKGGIMTTGLWKFSRHPNYFGEATMWWAMWVISLAVIPQFWFVTILSPLLITFLLLKVSGIPMLEKRWEGREDWEAYKQKTNAFFPWKPRHDKSV